MSLLKNREEFEQGLTKSSKSAKTEKNLLAGQIEQSLIFMIFKEIEKYKTKVFFTLHTEFEIKVF